MMIDTHCHLDLPVFDGDRSLVLERSRRAGVDQWVVPAIRLSDFCRLAAVRQPGVHLALGFHPLFVEEHGEEDIPLLEAWVRELQPVAVGEIGLDYLAPEATHDRQRQMLEGQLRLAKACRLPVLLHVRRAHDSVLALLRRLSWSSGGIVHAFGGSLQQGQGYLALGFKLGFGGVVTHEGARRIRQIAASLPDDAIVLETDAPDLSSSRHLGERNEPCWLPEVVEALAQLRQTTATHIMEMTTLNANAVLNLPSGLNRIQD